MTTPTPTGQNLTHSLLNVILVLVEAVLTLILRFDANLRQAAYPLAKDGTLVCIRTYLPHTQIYATFGYKGILLDDEMPVGKSQPDVIINAYSFQLVGAVLGNHSSQVDALQIRGDHDKVVLIKAFLAQLGLANLLQGILHKFGGKPKVVDADTSKAEKLVALKDDLAQQRLENEALTTTNQRLNVQLKEAEGKAKSMSTLAIVFAAVAFIAIASHFFY